ncbi:MAG TPA: EthD family reductase [Paraburkholderia sp.]|jgi:uncharacterized protein (TIGR02118 family)
MAKLVVLYSKPSDPAAFDAYYESTHAPLAKKIPGLKRYEISTGPVKTPAGDAPWHLVAILGFDSVAALQAGLASPEGQAAAGDLGNFAQAGAEMLIFESKDA